jgi:hypothetical protein
MGNEFERFLRFRFYKTLAGCFFFYRKKLVDDG